MKTIEPSPFIRLPNGSIIPFDSLEYLICNEEDSTLLLSYRFISKKDAETCGEYLTPVGYSTGVYAWNNATRSFMNEMSDFFANFVKPVECPNA